MQDFELAAHAKDKLRIYRREAEHSRFVPRRSWRSRAARALRGLADGLEPHPTPSFR
jgi:hypothetical protein